MASQDERPSIEQALQDALDLLNRVRRFLSTPGIEMEWESRTGDDAEGLIGDINNRLRAWRVQG